VDCYFAAYVDGQPDHPVLVERYHSVSVEDSDIDRIASTVKRMGGVPKDAVFMGYPSIVQDIAQRVLRQMPSSQDDEPVDANQNDSAGKIDNLECSPQLPAPKAVAASESDRREQKKAKHAAYICEPLAIVQDRPGYRLKKHQYAAIAHETVRCCNEGKFVNGDGVEVSLPIRHAVESTRLHPANAALPKLPPSRNSPCIVNVVLGSTLVAADSLVKQGLRTCVLNFASAKNPGGGFLNGANAQEEALARASAIYLCLTKSEVQAFYKENERDKSCVYTDNTIISPEVPVFLDDIGCKLEAPYNIGIITSPCPNMGVAATRASSIHGVEAIKVARRHRMARVLALCAAENFDALVLGAWGCGVFGNDPAEVAQEFRDLLRSSFRNVFPRVVFAIIDEPTFGIFSNAFFAAETDLEPVADDSPPEKVARPKAEKGARPKAQRAAMQNGTADSSQKGSRKK